MKRLILPALLGVLVVVGCGRKQPEAAPPPPPPVAARDTAAERRAREEQARRDAEAAAERARRDAEAAAARARASLTEMIHFDFDRFEIRSDAQDVLRRKVDVLRANPAVRLRIEGHADERGSVEYNLALGMRRASSAREFLTGFGLAAARFEVVSFGEERPLVAESNEDAWARNRRAEFHITAGGEQITGGR